MGNNNCGCQTTPTCKTTTCACPVLITTDCVTNTENLNCSNILKSQTLTETLSQLDQYICDRFESVTGFFDLINVGTGLGVYKGVSNIGRKELKTLLGSNLISLSQSDNEVTITVNETALNTFIETNQKTYSVSNIGTGSQIFKGVTVVNDNTQFNLRRLNSANNSINIVEAANDINLTVNQDSLPTYSVGNSGTGTGIFTDNTILGNNTQFNLKSIVSNTLTVTTNGTTLSIEQPIVSDIPRFVVNSAYTGIEETGSLSKPFKTIQAAINTFVGTGTALNPQFSGSEIIVQKGVGYNFSGTLNYNNLVFILDNNTYITSTPSGNWLCDLDSVGDVQFNIKLILNENSILTLTKSGFRNSGTTVNNLNKVNSKKISINGSGLISQNTININSNIYKIIESNFTINNTFFNDSSLQFDLQGISLFSATQTIYAIGGNSKISINNVNLSIGLIDNLLTSTIFFNQIGGSVDLKSSLLYVNNTVIIDRIFPLSKSPSIPCQLVINKLSIEGTMNTLFENISNLQPDLICTLSNTSFFNCNNLVKSPLVTWVSCLLFENVFTSGNLDINQVDLTAQNLISSLNSISGRVVEILVKYPSRLAAQAVLPPFSAFINTNGSTDSALWIRDTTFTT